MNSDDRVLAYLMVLAMGAMMVLQIVTIRRVHRIDEQQAARDTATLAAINYMLDNDTTGTLSQASAHRLLRSLNDIP